MAEGVSFSPSAAKRTAKVVRKVERYAIDQRGKRRSHGGIPGGRVFHITGERDGGGVYKGFQVKKPTSPLDPATGVTAATIGEDGDLEVTLLNLQEQDSDTHWLTHADNTKQLWCIGIPWGTDTDSRPAYAIVHVWVDPCDASAGPTGPTGPAGTNGTSITVTQGASAPVSSSAGDVFIRNA